MTDHFIPRSISKDQARDTGMAMVLTLLIIGHTHDAKTAWFSVATAALLLDMIWPMFYKPLAYVWLTISNVLGTVMSKVLLTVVFFVVVMPIGLVRKLLGEDLMKVKNWKKGKDSVFTVRDHKYEKADLTRSF